MDLLEAFEETDFLHSQGSVDDSLAKDLVEAFEDAIVQKGQERLQSVVESVKRVCVTDMRN